MAIEPGEGVLDDVPETENSSGIAKLIGRPNADHPATGDTEYDVSNCDKDPDDGVLTSRPATLNA